MLRSLDRRRLASGAAIAFVVIWVAATSRSIEATAVACAVSAVMAGAQRWPMVGACVAFGGLFAASPWTTVDDPFLAVIAFACYMAGRHAGPSRQPWAVAAVLVLVSANLLQPGRTPSSVVFPLLLTAGPWLLGLVVRAAAAREEQAIRHAAAIETDASASVQRATVEERLRIAREIHDVVAHEISAVSLLAQVARRESELGSPVSVESLRVIEHAAQEAMNDVRRILGVLRDSEELDSVPASGLEDVAALVAYERALGVTVAIEEHGQPHALSPALSHAGYRILQECLTNARRHGDGRSCVTIEWRPQSLHLTVLNPFDGRVPPQVGHGLAGMRERARLFGGVVETWARDGQWLVDVTLPVATVA